MWLFVTPSNLWLILVINLFVGVFWSPIDISQQNFYFSASSAENRAMYMAVFFAVFNLCGVALSNAVGGYLVQNVFGGVAAGVPLLQRLGWTKYHLLLLLSCLLRVAVALGLFPRLREEGEQPCRAALSAMCGEWYQAKVRWVLGVRATILRKRYRRGHARDHDAEE